MNLTSTDNKYIDILIFLFDVYFSFSCRTTTSDEIITQVMTLSLDTPAQVALFSEKTVENCLQTYFDQTYHTKLNIELTKDNNRRRIVKMIGRQNSVDEALEELLSLISLFCTKTFKEKTGQRLFSIFFEISSFL